MWFPRRLKISVDGNSDEVMEFLTIHEYHSQMDGTPAG
jgi:hypothetical protein